MLRREWNYGIVDGRLDLHLCQDRSEFALNVGVVSTGNVFGRRKFALRMVDGGRIWGLVSVEIGVGGFPLRWKWIRGVFVGGLDSCLCQDKSGFTINIGHCIQGGGRFDS